VPARVHVVEDLPLTPSGKLDRARLGSLPTAGGGPTERADEDHDDQVRSELAVIWRDLLELEQVGADDDFFELGGHSLLAVELFVTIEERFGCRLPLAQLFDTPTLAALADAVTAAAASNDAAAGPASTAVVLQTGEPGVMPLFWVPAIGGAVVSLRNLVPQLPRARPCYGLEAPGLGPAEVPVDRIEELAAVHIASMVALWPGPYVVGGNSFGGLVAWEVACQLAEAGATVLEVIIGDSRPFIRSDDIAPDLSRAELLARIAGAGVTERMQLVQIAHARAYRRYQPRPFAGDATVLGTARRRADDGDSLGWSPLVGGRLVTLPIDGDHGELMRPGNVASVARAVTARLEAVAPAPT
jgi:thioesterase domain-containing protein/acyl carrier protein